MLLKGASAKKLISYGGETQDTSAPLATDFNERKPNRIIEEAPARYPFEREGLVTEVLRKTHICACCGSNEKSVKVLKAQMHGHGFGGIVHKVYTRPCHVRTEHQGGLGKGLFSAHGTPLAFGPHMAGTCSVGGDQG